MSPEQIRGKALDRASRHLQLRLHDPRTARRQAAVHRHDTHDLLNKHLNIAAAAAASRQPQRDRRVRQLVRRMLAKKPEDRPAIDGQSSCTSFARIEVFKEPPQPRRAETVCHNDRPFSSTASNSD